MPVYINEIIIRAIITNDESKTKPGLSSIDKKTGDSEAVNKMEVLNLINEVLKNKKER